jgi:hypothetical protein
MANSYAHPTSKRSIRPTQGCSHNTAVVTHPPETTDAPLPHRQPPNKRKYTTSHTKRQGTTKTSKYHYHYINTPNKQQQIQGENILILHYSPPLPSGQVTSTPRTKTNRNSRTKDEIQRRTTYGRTAQSPPQIETDKTDNVQPGAPQGTKIYHRIAV